ncbi:zinc finger protein with KRAB and SCAN domains 2-like [Pungitius pungitius]|uniref:zinc finger protein with KRAB and SCAN domains 2-like n=1 Tax=Pungitius pungitius TaxID=134920 RepID=UPI002E163F33
MPPRSVLPWSTQEVQTFLGIIGEERVQRELDGMVRNEKVFQHVSERLAVEGYQRTSEQCRIKCKKLRSDYRKVKDHNSRSGVYRKDWKWLAMMDAIYGHRPASLGREGGIDTATSLLESTTEPPVEHPGCREEMEPEVLREISTLESISSPARTSTPTPPESAPSTSSEPRRFTIGKRKRGQQDVVAALAEMQAADEKQQEWLEKMEDRRDRRFEIMMEDAREARRHEADITRQHMEQLVNFNQAFLGTLTQLVQKFSPPNSVP